MDYLELNLEFCRTHLKMHKKAMKSYFGLVLLCLFIFLLNGFFVAQSKSIVNALVVGGIVANLIWLVVMYILEIVDYKIEKERELHLENIKDDENIQAITRQYKNSNDYFVTYIKELESKLKEKSNAPYPENKIQESTSPTAGIS